MASSDDDDDVAYDGDAPNTDENIIKCGTMEKVVCARNKGITFKVLYLQKNIFTYIDFYLIY